MHAGRTLRPDIATRATRAAGGHDRPGVSAADLTESMMAAYGPHLALDVIARTVYDVLDAHGHPRGEPVPGALRRTVVRRVRELSFAADPTRRPPLSVRAQAIARALAGGRS